VDPWTPRGLNQERTGYLVNQERKNYLCIKKKRIPCELKKERIRGTIKKKRKGKKKKGGKNLLLEIKKEDRKRKAYVLSSWRAYMCNRAINKRISLGTCEKKEEERGGQKVISG
jgi:hypothetical protein